MESNQAQVIRQDLRNFSGAVQNMVQGVRAASISWGDQNYQMLFRSIQGLSIKSKRVLDKEEAHRQEHGVNDKKHL